MVTSTPKLNLSKPAVGADDDLWGGYLNANTDIIDNLAPLDSPALVGTPTAPTPVSTDNTTKLATTAFVKTAIGSVPGGAVISATAPSLNPGALWWDSLGGQLYVRYDDGNSAQWTAASSLQGQAGVATTSYVDAAVANGQRNVGRNLIHNGLFTVAQRGAGPWTASAYTLDRWQAAIITDTASFSRVTLADAHRTQIGDEAAVYTLSNSFTGNVAAGAYNYISQSIEDIRRLAGKTVTVSFWASASATQKIGVNILQLFGSGGSPSAAIWALTTGVSFTLTGSFVRYAATIAIPSIVGKTLGTDGKDQTALAFWYSSGTTANALAGNIGVQSGTISIWGVQLEIAAPGQTAPTPLEKMDAQQTLAVCQRFYQTGRCYGGAYHTAGLQAILPYSLPVTMRAPPSSVVIVSSPGASNVTGINAPNLASATSLAFSATVTATGSWVIDANFTASADL